MMEISLVAAVTENNVIGREGGLPWRLSSDFKRFKAMTMGKPVIMGRKCYDSIGKPLPGRPNIVVTRNTDFRPEGVVVVHSLEDALEKATEQAKHLGVSEICVIGGAVVYDETMELATLLHITHILAEIEGDTFFPEIDPEMWEAGPAEELPAGEKDDHATRFVTYRRRPVSV